MMTIGARNCSSQHYNMAIELQIVLLSLYVK